MKIKYLLFLLILGFTGVTSSVKSEINDNKPLKVETDFGNLNKSEEKTVKLFDNSKSRKKEMAQAKKGDVVKVHYTGKLDDGSVFDSSKDREPLQFTIGEGKLIPGFEDAVVDLEVGKSTTVRIPFDKAYGPKRPEMVFDVKRTDFPANIEPKIGMQFKMEDQNGRAFIVMVEKVVDDTITLDANHPLAGKDLTFEITLEEISEK
ncbi:MAG: peptidylprolyl isomerase [bacterium]